MANSATHDFREDYEALALDERADWPTARLCYRRQVNRWHPDRFTERPRERAMAQQRFIQLTRSFDNLRAFHRANQRLPFEPIRHGDRARRAAHQDAASLDADPSPDWATDTAVHDAGLTGRGSPAQRLSGNRRPVARLRWVLASALTVLVTLATFFVLDRNARRAALEEGREVLRQTEPSEFMPSTAEVQRRSSRGVFIEREDSGRIGDQLMEDLFR